MSDGASSRRGLLSSVLSGVLGGLVVLIAGGALIATDVIETGETTRTVVESPQIARPATGDESGDGRSVSEIYRQEGAGVVYIQAR